MFGLIKTSIKLVLLLFIANWVYNVLLYYGVGLKFNDVKPGPCRVVPGIECGSEQISVTKNGLAFITNGFRLATNCNLKYLRGGIYLFDFNNPDKNVTKLEIIGDIDMNAFDPHGMDILEDGGNVIDIYVVNHANKKESVEIFKYDFNEPNKLRLVKTLRHELFVCLNSIAVVSKEKFYATNYMKYCHSKIPGVVEFEMLVGLNTANVVFYDNGKAFVAVETDMMLNGITLSKDKNKVFVLRSFHKSMYVFERNVKSNVLRKVKEHKFKFGGDNIFTDKQTGDVYMGTMKLGWCVIQMIANGTEYCSATGTKISPQSSDWTNVDVEEVLHLDGKDFVSGSSSFVHYKGHYLVGTIFNKLGYCRDKCVSKIKQKVTV